MHQEALTKNTKRILESLSSADFIKNFYLAGGTALALYLGHRFSADLDWFAEKFSYNPNFRKKLSKAGNLSIDSESEKTLNGSLNGVKISFFEYPYPLIAPKTQYKKNLYLASKPDIAVMKLDAIASRGTYKDFFDMYFLLREYDLETLLGFLKEKFTGIEYNEAHLVKSLTYFKDAKESEMPKMIKKINWEKVKENLTATVERYVKNK